MVSPWWDYALFILLLLLAAFDVWYLRGFWENRTETYRLMWFALFQILAAVPVSAVIRRTRSRILLEDGCYKLYQPEYNHYLRIPRRDVADITVYELTEDDRLVLEPEHLEPLEEFGRLALMFGLADGREVILEVTYGNGKELRALAESLR